MFKSLVGLVARKPSAVATITTAPAGDANATSEALTYARKYSANAANDSLAAHAQTRRATMWVVRIVLGITIPHQVSYLLSLVTLRFPAFTSFDSARPWLESIALIAATVVIPTAVDMTIVNMIRTLSDRVTATAGQIGAFVVLVVTAGTSATVNVIVPAPTIVRVMFAVAVALIPLNEGVRALARVDFGKLRRIERQALDEVAEPAPAPAAPARKPRVSNADKAREFVASNPHVTASQLVKATGVSYGTARKYVDAARADIEALRPMSPPPAPIELRALPELELAPAPARRRKVMATA